IGHRIHFWARDASGAMLVDERLPEGSTHDDALGAILRWTAQTFPQRRLVAAGHRVVHGGAAYDRPVMIDRAAIGALTDLIPLAPLHQPHHLAAIAALTRLYPALPQVACFDTSFHHTQPAVATAFALPRKLSDEGVRRYGFHGLSYEYVASVLPQVVGAHVAAGRVVVAHLGNGASMCAMRGRRSVATTMGFTALDGLPMGQRCGNLDPGVVLYLMQQKGMSADAVAALLYHDSGLLGVSGVSNDMRTLLASREPHAAEAVDLFVYRIGRELGSLAASLGGLDALVFTAGIGEHAAEIRRRVLQDAAWLGIEVDGTANDQGGPRLSRPGSKVSAWVIPTDEDLMIARHTWAILNPDRIESRQDRADGA
ncbi:MAG: acetate/propionate family kinase, partial [Reyranellaceae bacterium]